MVIVLVVAATVTVHQEVALVLQEEVVVVQVGAPAAWAEKECFIGARILI